MRQIQDFEYKETKRSARLVRFSIWKAGSTANAAVAEFFLTPTHVEDYDQTVSGWDFNLPGLPSLEVLTAIAQIEGLEAAR